MHGLEDFYYESECNQVPGASLLAARKGLRFSVQVLILGTQASQGLMSAIKCHHMKH